MAVSDAKRRANDKWDKENMKNISCRLRRDVAEEFQVIASRNGTTPNALIRGWIMEYMENNRTEE